MLIKKFFCLFYAFLFWQYIALFSKLYIYIKDKIFLMSSAISRLWSRQMRTVWDVHHFVICSHLLIISVITLFVMLRIWSAQSDNVQVYSMSGRGEVWMNGDPHLWLSLTGLTPLT